jgi:hypothetical protein
MATQKYCKILRGVIEVLRADQVDLEPFVRNPGVPDNFVALGPGALVNLPADEADRLAALKIVEILP